MVAVTVTSDPTFEIVGRRTLFTLPLGASYDFQRVQYDVTPDDQRFVMFRDPDPESRAESANLIVVENFHEELKTLVGN